MNPDQYTLQELMLDVGDGHQLYVQDWGNKTAKTAIIFLHGGPGGGCSDGQKQQFDPLQHRVIFFDQRGGGKSLPMGSIEHNTTADIIEDINKIAAKFELESFVLAGRSWGSCLALCYAIAHPSKVEAIVLGGVYLGSSAQVDFDDRSDRYQSFYPEAWETLLAETPEHERHAPIPYHFKQTLSDDTVAAKRSAYIYSNFIVQMIGLDDRVRIQDFETFEPSGFKIQAYYKLNQLFIEDNYIMDHAPQLTMPIWIIQGRYDMLCTPEFAYNLHKALPNSKLLWATAGHTGSDRAVFDIAKTVFLGIV